ncbi:hypothetical protein HY031_00655 [Candidatus Gottesmanbacteria bacterium]|nr:hypothetical protein [Candidatus Gottesmanbacteria bacterium]
MAECPEEVNDRGILSPGYDKDRKISISKVSTPREAQDMKLLVLLAGAVVVITGLVVWGVVRRQTPPIASSVLGLASLPSQTHFDALTIPSLTPSPSVKSLVPVTPTPTVPEASTVAIIDGPGELVEGGIATFTWHVGGLTRVIHTTTIYYGTTSAQGAFDTYITPADAHYTYQLKDFLQGDYTVPLRFVGNINLLTPGMYFYRAYALIDGKHYWSGERTFEVKQIPKHEIKIVYRPGNVPHGANATFTWDVYGPAATTGFTTVVGGKQSKPGILDPSVDIPKTPYTVLVEDFTRGTYNVPLRFTGNANVQDAGVYYFRALAYINGKNIWSDEYSFTVE